MSINNTNYISQSELQIEPRYPLFGGWKATFVIGYGLPLEDFLFESDADGRRYLNFSFGCPLLETVVDKLTIKVGFVSNFVICYHYLFLCFKFVLVHLMIDQVVLPEGSKDPFVAAPFPIDQYLEVIIFTL